LALLSVVAACCKEVPQRPSSNRGGTNMIDRDLLVRMFADMHENDINTDQDLLWGYFFTDRDAAKLKVVVPELERAGYRYVDVHQAENDSGVKPYYILHVEKVETHTADSLFARNKELYALAERHRLDSYDGMDVGRVDGKPFTK
jgi:hypothetical protein